MDRDAQHAVLKKFIIWMMDWQPWMNPDKTADLIANKYLDEIAANE